MRAFTDKGRFSELMQRIPVRVILNELTALLGAAQHAEARRSGPAPSA
jgi:glucokinase